MTKEQFEMWLARYGSCWVHGDSDGIVKLFTEDAKYYETPFDEPMVGASAIRKYWQEGAELAQEDVEFQFDNLVIDGNRCFAHWSASFIRVSSGSRVELDGFLQATFGPYDKCCCFREWWHKRELKALYQ